jgi:hypothetical protein
MYELKMQDRGNAMRGIEKWAVVEKRVGAQVRIPYGLWGSGIGKISFLHVTSWGCTAR